jgi:hypothetical protein
MKAKLIKDEDGYSLFTREENSTNRKFIATTQGMYVDHKLSKQNCDEIFGFIDVVYKQVRNGFDGVIDSFTEAFAKECINKAMELNKDKLFTLEDMKRAIDKAKQGSVKETHNGYGRPTERRFDLDDLSYDEIIQSLQQPAEIEVEIEMICPHPMDTYRCGLQYGCDGDGCNHPNQIPYLDSEGCLILKRI